jgi:hypothetical protein
MSSLTADALSQIQPWGGLRPYFNSEWGSNGKFEETSATQGNADVDKVWYFHHAYDSVYSHVAAGGAGTGLHWGDRCDPGGAYGAGMANINGTDWYFGGVAVTGGVRAIYYLLAEFLKRSGINFSNFPYHHMTTGASAELQLQHEADFLVTGCSDGRQALVFLLRKRPYTLYADFDSVTPVFETLIVRGLHDGKYVIDVWEGWNNDVLAYDTAATPAQLPVLDAGDFQVAHLHLTVSENTLTLPNLTMRKGLFLTIWPE